MKNYERPTVIMAGELAEGVYMLSGDGQAFSLRDTVEPVTEPYEYAQDVAQSEAAAGGIENSVGGEPETGVEGEITEPEAGADGEIPEGETPDPDETGADGDADATPETDAEAGAGGKPDKDVEDPDSEDVGVDAEMKGSARITCESRYMNGVWQGAKEGAWGSLKLGCKEVLGCTGCPADNRDGCGLLKPGSSRYFNMIGSLKPGWEASGKGPDDDPYM